MQAQTECWDGGQQGWGRPLWTQRTPVLLKPAMHRAGSAGANRTEGAKALRPKHAWSVWGAVKEPRCLERGACRESGRRQGQTGREGPDRSGGPGLPKNQLCGLQPDPELLQILRLCAGRWPSLPGLSYSFFFFLISLKFE